MTFSERMKIEKARETIQLNSMDTHLRVAIYNCLHDSLVNNWYLDGGWGCGYEAGKKIWADFFYQPADTFKESPYDFRLVLKKHISDASWNKIYDLLEFTLVHTPLPLAVGDVNKILEREMSGYRIRKNIVVPISDSIELAAIDSALAVADRFGGARQHIVSALEKLSQKPQADLRNAITEAVSAVESASRVITGMHKATLSDALKVLEKNGNVHPALKDAWLKLYGYTSDEHGLRHAMTEDPNIDFSTAKYMVVSCSAFLNLLAALP